MGDLLKSKKAKTRKLSELPKTEQNRKLVVGNVIMKGEEINLLFQITQIS